MLEEEEENGLASDARSHCKTPMLLPSETPGRLREAPRTDCPFELTWDWVSRSSRHAEPIDVTPGQLHEAPQTDCPSEHTRDWVSQSSRHSQPTGVICFSTSQPPKSQLPLEHHSTPQLPRITLDQFGGSALEWPRWIALFKALVHDRDVLTDVERLTYLQSHLTVPAREAVRGLFTDPRLYHAALRELEKEFGDPARVIQATMKRILTARPVRDGELSALTELSRDLHTAVSVLQSLH